jgi:LysR family cyn operon transcriptional activator
VQKLFQQIQQLENDLKTPLFDRIAKRVRLTEAGKLFLPTARKTVRDAEEGRQLLKNLSELTAGTLTIGLTYGLSDMVY